MDVLTDVLRTLRLKGTVYFEADFRAPWGMDIKGGQVANFHLVVRGNCWLRLDPRDEPLALEAGDLLILPHGHRHTLLHSPQGQAQPAEALLAAPARSDEARVVYGGQGEATTLICGHFEFDRNALHPMLKSLPRLLHIRRAEHPDAAWMVTATSLTLAESGGNRPGSGAVVDRLAEVLLVQALRVVVEDMRSERGFLAAMADPPLAEALSLMHRQPQQPWNVKELARRAGVSRSLFAARFKETIGASPMQYLTAWRMQKARDLLTGSDLTIPQVAEAVGYQSEWAFAKAFKRVLGRGPGAVRRSRQSGEAEIAS